MKLSSLFLKEAMQLNLQTTTKDDTLHVLANAFATVGGVNDVDGYVTNLKNRESQSTTGVGDEIAIPHAQHPSITQPAIIFAKSENGVEWASFDNQPAKLIFMIAAPEGAGGEHLKALASLSKVLMNADAKAALLNVQTPEDVVNVIEQYEEKSEEEVTDMTNEATKSYILAVTACPTGIAHTFMAAEKLNQVAKDKGVDIKVETNGQGGVGNRLTNEDIQRATAIIVAADKNVAMDRFDGKPVIICKVADGIHKADALIEKAVNADAPVYKANNAEQTTDVQDSETMGRRAYKHLMNGISHMLPFVVAGGILIAISFFWGITSFDPKDPTFNPIALFIFTLGKLAFALMLPVLAGFIGHSIADRPGLVIGFVGGMLASPGAFGDTASLVSQFGLQSSGFLGALVAGFAAGGIVLVLRRVFSFLPKSLEGLKPIFIFPILGVLLIGLVMLIISTPLAAVTDGLTSFINSIPKEAKVLVGFVVAAMMSIDMGGPINKASYATGTALVTAAATGVGSDVMAAVMVGGMVPPMAIFLSALLKKDLWPASQRDSALVNFVMGAAFITEGAIPFAASNPAKVIPSLAIGAGVAGSLSMLFGVFSLVPHGGLFAALVGGITNPLMYIVAWLVGSLLGAILLIVLLGKKQNA